MTGYWDIHNHILPGVDDGSGCMRETMEMLEEEYRQGVRHIVFTPHYRRDMFAIPREEIQAVYARVCEMAADRFPEMEFYLGCEYYIHSDTSVERLRGNLLVAGIFIYRSQSKVFNEIFSGMIKKYKWEK